MKVREIIRLIEADGLARRPPARIASPVQASGQARASYCCGQPSRELPPVLEKSILQQAGLRRAATMTDPERYTILLEHAADVRLGDVVTRPRR